MKIHLVAHKRFVLLCVCYLHFRGCYGLNQECPTKASCAHRRGLWKVTWVMGMLYSTVESPTSEFGSRVCHWMVGPGLKDIGCWGRVYHSPLLLASLCLLPDCCDVSRFLLPRLFYHAISVFKPADHRLKFLKHEPK